MRKLVVKKAGETSCGCSSNTACCSQDNGSPERKDEKWSTGRISTPAGVVLQVSTTLSWDDRFGAWKARWGRNRMNYKIEPGLYCTGNPDSSSPVLVTANYKMTFDSLRKELSGFDAWILVLDTKGVNVWCAAGKGTFGTEELISRLLKTGLSKVVSHRTLILPQLAAPGVSAHKVLKKSGFKVVYGPVRAVDIKTYISNGMKADKEMRVVKFTMYDRLVLTPIELVTAFKWLIILFGVLFILNSIGFGQFGFTDFIALICAVLAGSVLTPVLLPWIPGRAFAFKGWLLGLIPAICINLLYGWPGTSDYSLIKGIVYMLVVPSISSFIAMNFTGCSTYTSLSGVRKEMRIAVPIQAVAVCLGVILTVVDNFVRILN